MIKAAMQEGRFLFSGSWGNLVRGRHVRVYYHHHCLDEYWD